MPNISNNSEATVDGAHLPSRDTTVNYSESLPGRQCSYIFSLVSMSATQNCLFSDWSYI